MTAGDLSAGLTASRRGDEPLEAFREEVRQAFGVPHVFLASSGRGALSILLQGLHRLNPQRDVVALPAYTSFSVPSAVVNAGLKVSLYDVDPATLSPVPESLDRAVGQQTLAVVACHLFGYVADLGLVRDVADRAGAVVVDDAAQAMGARYRGTPVGTFGDAGLYSLSRGKNINAVDGGIIVTHRDDLAGELGRTTLAEPAEGTPKLFCKALILSALLRPSLYWLPRSLPFLNIGASFFDPEFPVAPFTPFQAGIARRMLARLPAITAARRDAARWYASRIDGAGAVTVPCPLVDTTPVYLRFPVIAGEGAPVVEAPELGVVRSYPAPLDDIPGLAPYLSTATGPFPGARRLARQLLTLPTHQLMTDGDRHRVLAHLARQPIQ